MVGVLSGVSRTRTTQQPRSGSGLRAELAQLARPSLVLALVLGALVNGATFCTFTYLAPVVTEVAGLSSLWVPVVLAAFGTGSFVGVTVAGRFADRHPSAILAPGGVLLLAGWVAFAMTARVPAALVGLAFLQGALSFAVGSTLISRVLYRASAAPTMAGSYATAAFNVGAAVGPAVGGLALSTTLGFVAPAWVSAILTAAALLITLVTLRNLTRPEPTQVRTPGPSWKGSHWSSSAG
jgi:DHA1 family chloramphenicol resistance protein-like MFS transporter